MDKNIVFFDKALKTDYFRFEPLKVYDNQRRLLTIKPDLIFNKKSKKIQRHNNNYKNI